MSNEVSNSAPSNLVVAGRGWTIACSSVEEWNEVIESLKEFKHNETKKLFRTLQGTYMLAGHEVFMFNYYVQ